MKEIEKKNNSPAHPDILDILAVWCGVFGILIVANGVGKSLGPFKFISIPSTCMLFVLAYILMRRFRVRQILRWKAISKRSFWKIIAVVVGAAVLLDEMDRLVSIFLPVPQSHLEYLKAVFNPVFKPDLVWVLCGIGVAAPFVEESIFRGFIQQVLERHTSVLCAVILTSLFFSLMHLQPWWFIQTFVMATLAGYTAIKWNSIIPGILIHAANNLWSGFLMLVDFPFLKFYLLDGHVHPIWVIAAAASILYGLKSDSL